VPYSRIFDDNEISILNKPSFGMLDFAYYFNNAISNNKPLQSKVNVHEHSDAGLVSIHFGSTILGLQFYDNNKKQWIDIPERSGVIFCGNHTLQISKGTIKSAIHRVLHSSQQNQVRFSSWYEVCINSQAEFAKNAKTMNNSNKNQYNNNNNYHNNNNNNNNNNINIFNNSKDKFSFDISKSLDSNFKAKKNDNITVKVVGQSKRQMKVSNLKKNSTINDIYQEVENAWGIPSEKSGIVSLDGNLYLEKGLRPSRNDTLEKLGIQNGTILYLH